MDSRLPRADSSVSHTFILENPYRSFQVNTANCRQRWCGILKKLVSTNSTGAHSIEERSHVPKFVRSREALRRGWASLRGLRKGDREACRMGWSQPFVWMV